MPGNRGKSEVMKKQAEYERTLRARREAVLASLVPPSETRAHFGRLADDDQAQVLQHESVTLELNNLDYGKLRMIEEALDRLRIRGLRPVPGLRTGHPAETSESGALGALLRALPGRDGRVSPRRVRRPALRRRRFRTLTPRSRRS